MGSCGSADEGGSTAEGAVVAAVAVDLAGCASSSSVAELFLLLLGLLLLLRLLLLLLLLFFFLSLLESFFDEDDDDFVLPLLDFFFSFAGIATTGQGKDRRPLSPLFGCWSAAGAGRAGRRDVTKRDPSWLCNLRREASRVQASTVKVHPL